MNTVLLRSITDLEQEIRMLKQLQNDLTQEFRAENLDRLDWKIKFLSTKLDEKRAMLKKLEWFFDTYIVQIQQQIQTKKRCISRNQELLKQHPEVLYKLLQDIHRKEQQFGSALIQLKSSLVS